MHPASAPLKTSNKDHQLERPAGSNPPNLPPVFLGVLTSNMIYMINAIGAPVFMKLHNNGGCART